MIRTAIAFALAIGCVAPEVDDGQSATRSSSVSSVLAHAERGTWVQGGVLRAWADASVTNVRYDKRVLAEVATPYANGAWITTLHDATHKGAIGGRERWGVDTIELHQVGPNGAAPSGSALVRFRMQYDLDRDGRDEMIETDWASLAPDAGSPEPPANDPWAAGLSSPVRTVDRSSTTPELRFAPFDDPGALVVRELDAVIAAKKDDPAGRHTVHAAIFNINDPRIVGRLIDAHRAGVEVRLLTDARKLRPTSTWMTGDDALLAAGVPLLGIARRGNGAMHLKMALFDGKKVLTGSANWEHGASFENHELAYLTDDPAIVAAYAQRFERLAGGVAHERVGSRDVAFGPDESPIRTTRALVDAAKRSIHVAMFTAKDFDGFFGSLIAARRRGVDVLLVTDARVAEGSEFHGAQTADDQTDERLEAAGVRVVRAAVPFAKYASMHHKFMVIDGEIAALGALNWYYDAVHLNDEDQLVVRDAAVALRLEGELAELSRRYDPAFDAAAWPAVDVAFETTFSETFYGDDVVVLGDLPELGAWSSPIALTGYPTWRGRVRLPIGTRARFKFAVRRKGGALEWERGDDRRLDVGIATQVVRGELRR